MDFWETKLRGEASLLPSLQYFQPNFMSLSTPHPVWATAGSNPYEISKAIQQARFISGRYRTQLLAKHWSSNTEGFCLASSCFEQEETVEHILLHCKAYTEHKKGLYSLWLSAKNLAVRALMLKAFSSEAGYLLQFILDCSVLPEVIAAVQANGKEVLDEPALGASPFSE